MVNLHLHQHLVDWFEKAENLYHFVNVYAGRFQDSVIYLYNVFKQNYVNGATKFIAEIIHSNFESCEKIVNKEYILLECYVII